MDYCMVCGREIYKRESDGKEMMRVWKDYDGQWDWRDLPHPNHRKRNALALDRTTDEWGNSIAFDGTHILDTHGNTK